MVWKTNVRRRTTMSAHCQPSAVLDRPNPFAVLFEEITAIAQQMLRQSSYFELRDVSCEFSGGVLTLRGRVPSYHLKQLAQASVASVPGVVEVHNRVEVTTPRTVRNAGWSEHESMLSAQVG
jgi:osmotically-inducible protein OsmY